MSIKMKILPTSYLLCRTRSRRDEYTEIPAEAVEEERGDMQETIVSTEAQPRVQLLSCNNSLAIDEWMVVPIPGV